MLNFHEILIKLRNDLGYKTYNKGACSLYAEKAIDAFLVGEYSTTFKDRCYYIEKHYEQLPAWLQQVKEENKSKSPSSFSSEERLMIHEVAAFIEQGELYMSAMDYPGVFGKTLTQSHIQTISQYAQSDKLEKLGGRVCLASLVGIYSLKKLTNYIKRLNKLAATLKTDFALSLSSDNHRIGLCYSHTQKSWLLIDANEPLAPPIPASNNNALTLANELLIAFSDTESQTTSFATQLFTTGKKQSLLQKQVNTWKQHKTFFANHGISSSNRTRKTERGITLAWMAAENGDIDTLHKLMKAKKNGHLVVNLNQSSDQGVTPAWIAAQEGHVEVLRELMKAKNRDGTLVLNLNQADNEGITPAGIAAECGRTEVLRALMEAKNSDGNLIVDLNKKSNQGVTPAYIAAQEGHAEVLQVLMEAKKLDGNLVVDFNQANNEGVTPLYIAAQKGHFGVVSLLLDAKVDTTCSYKGISPLQIATSCGHSRIVALLEKTLMASTLPPGNPEPSETISPSKMPLRFFATPNLQASNKVEVKGVTEDSQIKGTEAKTASPDETEVQEESPKPP